MTYAIFFQKKNNTQFIRKHTSFKNLQLKNQRKNHVDFPIFTFYVFNSISMTVTNCPEREIKSSISFEKREIFITVYEVYKPIAVVLW